MLRRVKGYVYGRFLGHSHPPPGADSHFDALNPVILLSPQLSDTAMRLHTTARDETCLSGLPSLLLHGVEHSLASLFPIGSISLPFCSDTTKGSMRFMLDPMFRVRIRTC